nr:MAG TPA: hypothetical protein [Siphoviridae sp. cta6m1]
MLQWIVCRPLVCGQTAPRWASLILPGWMKRPADGETLTKLSVRSVESGLMAFGSIAVIVSEVKRLSVESSRIISEMRGVCMNDIENINVAPNSYFQRIVKPCLLDLRKRKDDAKTDMERGYYEDRYAAQAKDFAEALHISADALDELIGGV